LVSELASPRYKFTSTNKIQIESKEDMKRRGVPSPNDADALILTFAVNEAILAGSRSRLRGQPLKRRIGGIV
jgi:phage terminase large subunit